MKSKLFISCSIIITMFIMFLSCSDINNKEDHETQKDLIELEKRSYLDINNTIKESSLLYFYQQDNTSRSWLGKLWKRIKHIYLSDSSGWKKARKHKKNKFLSLINSVCCSVSSAIVNDSKDENEEQTISTETDTDVQVLKTSSPVKAEKPMTDLVCMDKNILQNSIIYLNKEDKLSLSLIDSIGYYHNKVIQEIFLEHNDKSFWRNLSEDELYLIVEEKVQNLNISNIDYYLEESYIFDDIDIDCLLDIDNCNFETADECINYLVERNPQYKDVIPVLIHYLEFMDNTASVELREQYTRDVITTILESNIDTSSKQFLDVSIRLGYSSSLLWK